MAPLIKLAHRVASEYVARLITFVPGARESQQSLHERGLVCPRVDAEKVRVQHCDVLAQVDNEVAVNIAFKANVYWRCGWDSWLDRIAERVLCVPDKHIWKDSFCKGVLAQGDVNSLGI